MTDAVLVADPLGRPNPALVVAGLRAGALGILDLAGDGVARRAQVDAVTAWSDRPFAVRVTGPDSALPDQVEVVVLRARPGLDLSALIAPWSATGRRVVVEVASRADAAAAVAAGADGLIASGSEAGGRVGDTEAFILLQQLLADAAGLDRAFPIWARGGIGLHTAAAAVAGGAAGVLLDGQLALTPEAQLDAELRRAIAAMDGSETRVVGGHRVYVRPDLPVAQLPDATPPEQVAAALGPDLRRDLVPLGQDAAFAAELARRFGTVGGIVQAIRQAIIGHRAQAETHRPLAPGAGVASAHGIRYPIAQGPMTRVSDTVAFAEAVAAGGGLPFLALALMPGREARPLLERAAEALGDRPWGVGILGFVPEDVRADQLAAVHAVRPPVAIIAGGRPSQAEPLEAAGTSTYLHVPSPGLLDRFLKDGARKFVFEGRECGGHVGPRSSFALWDAQIERLLAVDDPERLHVLFAGGIHDSRSASMAAVAAAPLVARGARIGVLMGTAYLFTDEAVGCGAIQPAFQQVAVECSQTVLLETSPGHATRCVETGYVREFASRRRELEAVEPDAKARWSELENLNLGRLRMASKGIRREGDALVPIGEAEQRRAGMYMIGEVATLRSATTNIGDLHADVSEGATARLAGPQVVAAEPRRAPRPLGIAIVGMEALLPGASSLHEFWANVVGGVDSITEVPAERWDARLFHEPGLTDASGRKTPSKWGGFLGPIGFDPLRYGIPPAALAAIEPVQLLSLEVAARALADAGYAEREFDRSRASVVFAAEAGSDLANAYFARSTLRSAFGDQLPAELDEWLPELTEDSFPGMLSNVIAGRIANRLDLGGVNFTVDAACASSLAAVHVACRELASGGSDLVLCGGADLHNGINDYLVFSAVGALSPTGRCRTFDAGADGIALGEGVACVVLKRLADAERDGDRVYAVIDAIAGSSDGRHLGLTAPRKEGQQRAIRRAWDQAGWSGASVGLVEAHGTGTAVGDRTELATLTELFRDEGAEPGACALGSVKSQIGHTKCAAGLAGLVKAAKAVHHGVLPPTLNLTRPTGAWRPESSPFRFLDRPRPWAERERRAGVSAFGFGGTNFHALLTSYQGADEPAHGLDDWPAELFVFRAQTAEQAWAAVAAFSAVVEAIVDADPRGERHRLSDLAATCALPGHGPIQVALVADDLGDLLAKLRDPGDRSVFVAAGDRGGEVAFVFPGQGSQRPGMLADLFVAFPLLRDLLLTGGRWADALLPPAAFSAEERAAQLAAITRTDVAQPTLGVAALAMTRTLGRLGVSPAATAGHSYGELCALAAAGVFDDETLLALSEARGASILDAADRTGGDPGTMAAVSLGRDALAARLAEWPDVVVANDNGPNQAVLSGPTASVRAAVAGLAADGVSTRMLPVACAFHSPVIAEAGDQLAARLADAAVGAPRLPVWSNVDAGVYPADPAAVRARLAEQVGSPVRFREQIEAMYASGVRVFVEAGAGRVLTDLVGRILGDRPHRAIACDADGEHGLRRLLLAVAELATVLDAGVEIDTRVLFEGRAEPLDLRRLPRPRPGWLVDGALVRTADGRPVDKGLRPATEAPRVSLSVGDAGGGGLVDERERTVLEYLESTRRIVEAERDVMLRYLGAAPEAPRPATAVGASSDAAAELVARHQNGKGNGNGHRNGHGGNGNGNGRAAAVDLLATVVHVVSERTGYPAEMLDPDLDLEADLSIDSIKRVEIVGEITERVGVPASEHAVEELAKLKTLRAVVAWLEARTDGAAPPPRHADADTDVGRHGPTADLLTTVIEVVSERTGYPAEMLDPDLDLEADLSIDSIKRVEIVGEITERVGRHGGEHAVEELAKLKSIRAVVAWLEANSPNGNGTPVPPAPAAPPAAPARLSARRYAVEPVDLGPAVPLGTIEGRQVLLHGPDSIPLAAALEEALRARGACVRRAAGGALADADVVVDFSAAHPNAPVDARAVFAGLRPALFGRASTLLAVSLSSQPSGVPGLVRALARELPGRAVRSVEVDAEAIVNDAVGLAAALVDELLDPSAPVSVSWAGGRRSTRRVVEAPAPAPAPSARLGPDSVVVVTGGARGITARAARGLAASTGCRLVLVGRTPRPGSEDPCTASAADPDALRRRLIELGDHGTPAAVEAASRRILADREIRATLAALEAGAAHVEYHAVDVRDGAAFGELLDGVRRRFGRLDGIVHGAGVLDDRLIADKTADGFDRVFGTKVEPAQLAIDHIGPDTRFVALFGSVSGVFGNRGQCDYSAANDALSALARAHDGRDGCRVVCVNWGPWAGGGMVSPALERDYARRGIALLDPDEGVSAFLAEIAAGAGAGSPDVVVMSGDPTALDPSPPAPASAGVAVPVHSPG